MYRTYKVPEGTKQVMAALMISWIAEQKAPHFCWPAYKNPEQQRAIAICELMDKHTARINELLESGNMHAISHSDGLPTKSISADTMLYVGEAQQYLATMGYELEFEPWQDAGDGKADQAEASPVEDATAPADGAMTSRIHSTRQTSRRDVLTPVIEYAQSLCKAPSDVAEVWAQLLVLAQRKYPPLLGSTEDGLQVLDWDERYFKRADLRKRMQRQKPAA